MVARGSSEVSRGSPCWAHCEDLVQAKGKTKQDCVGLWVQGPRGESPRDFGKRMRMGEG